MANQLSAQVSIDVSVAVSSLDKLGNAVSQFTAQFQQEVNQTARSADKLEKEFVEVGRDAQKMATEVKKATAPLDKLQSELAQTAVAAAKTGDALDKKVSKGSNNATQALTNVNRVIQDSPFGIIGIANNIDPLIQSFQTLSKTSGGVGGALKALGSSLIGPGGVLFAFSALSTAAIFLVQKYGSLTAGIDAILGLTIPLEQAQRRLADSFAEAAGKAAGEQAQLNGLLSVARNKELSDKARTEAINQLNKEYGDYLPKLNLENVGTKEVTNSVNELNKSLIRQAKIRGAQDLIAEETTKILKAQSTALKDQATTLQTTASVLASGLPIAGLFEASQIGKGFKTQQKIIKDSTEAIKEFQRVLNELLTEEALSGNLFIEPEVKAPKVKAKVDKLVFTQVRNVTVPELKIDIAKSTLGTGLSVLSGEASSAAAITRLAFGDIQETYEKLTSSLSSADNDLASILKIEFDAGVAEIQKARELFEKTGIGADDLISGDIANKIKERLQKVAAVITTFKQEIEESFKSFRADGLTGLFDSIGTAIGSGENILAAASKSILGSLGELIQSIGKSLIKAGIALLPIKKLLDASILTNPALAIALGAAAVAVGSVIKASIPKFATGGIVTGPTIGMIGEGGQPEVILPLSKINQFMEQGGGGGGRLEAIVSGDALRFILNRNDRKQRRLL